MRRAHTVTLAGALAMLLTLSINAVVAQVLAAVRQPEKRALRV